MATKRKSMARAPASSGSTRDRRTSRRYTNSEDRELEMALELSKADFSAEHSSLSEVLTVTNKTVTKRAARTKLENLLEEENMPVSKPKKPKAATAKAKSKPKVTADTAQKSTTAKPSKTKKTSKIINTPEASAAQTPLKTSRGRPRKTPATSTAASKKSAPKGPTSSTPAVKSTEDARKVDGVASVESELSVTSSSRGSNDLMSAQVQLSSIRATKLAAKRTSAVVKLHRSSVPAPAPELDNTISAGSPPFGGRLLQSNLDDTISAGSPPSGGIGVDVDDSFNLTLRDANKTALSSSSTVQTTSTSSSRSAAFMATNGSNSSPSLKTPAAKSEKSNSWCVVM